MNAEVAKLVIAVLCILGALGYGALYAVGMVSPGQTEGVIGAWILREVTPIIHSYFKGAE